MLRSTDRRAAGHRLHSQPSTTAVAAYVASPNKSGTHFTLSEAAPDTPAEEVFTPCGCLDVSGRPEVVIVCTPSHPPNQGLLALASCSSDGDLLFAEPSGEVWQDRSDDVHSGTNDLSQTIQLYKCSHVPDDTFSAFVHGSSWSEATKEAMLQARAEGAPVAKEAFQFLGLALPSLLRRNGPPMQAKMHVVVKKQWHEAVTLPGIPPFGAHQAACSVQWLVHAVLPALLPASSKLIMDPLIGADGVCAGPAYRPVPRMKGTFEPALLHYADTLKAKLQALNQDLDSLVASKQVIITTDEQEARALARCVPKQPKYAQAPAAASAAAAGAPASSSEEHRSCGVSHKRSSCDGPSDPSPAAAAAASPDKSCCSFDVLGVGAEDIAAAADACQVEASSDDDEVRSLPKKQRTFITQPTPPPSIKGSPCSEGSQHGASPVSSSSSSGRSRSPSPSSTLSSSSGPVTDYDVALDAWYAAHAHLPAKGESIFPPPSPHWSNEEFAQRTEHQQQEEREQEARKAAAAAAAATAAAAAPPALTADPSPKAIDDYDEKLDAYFDEHGLWTEPSMFPPPAPRQTNSDYCARYEAQQAEHRATAAAVGVEEWACGF